MTMSQFLLFVICIELPVVVILLSPMIGDAVQRWFES
jgi:hypothetical protein